MTTATIGASIKTRREAAGLSVKALADLSGVSTATIWNIETGKAQRPHQGTLAKLEPHLGASPTRGTPTQARRAARPRKPDARAEPESEAPAPESPEQPQSDDESRAAGVLQFIDQIITAASGARALLVPGDEEVARPMKSRDLASLAERVAACEDALIRAGLMK